MSPATTPDQPLGVAATTLPKRSATRQVVVSRASASGRGTCRCAGSAAGSSTAFFERGSPGRRSSEACSGSISPRRSAAYSGSSRAGQRNVREMGVGVVGVAIGESQLDRLDDRVDRVRAVMPHRLQVECLRGAGGTRAGTGPWVQAPHL